MRNFLVLFLLVGFNHLFAQERYAVSGYIKDADNGEDLIGVTIYEPSRGVGAVTNVYGFYSIMLPQGDYELRITSVGYQTQVQKISLTGNTTLNIKMLPEIKAMQEIVITDRPIDENVSEVTMSRMRMDIQQVKKLPPLFGAPDIIKTIQLMPGV